MNGLGTDNVDDLTVLALGGNLSGAHSSLETALDGACSRLAQVGLAPVRRSRWWRSAAWPDPADPPFLNGVVLVRTALPPVEVMEALHRVEAEFGPREGPRNSPRVLDLDLIASGRAVIDESGLIVPHPRAAERYFVMGPLAEIAPGRRSRCLRWAEL